MANRFITPAQFAAEVLRALKKNAKANGTTLEKMLTPERIY